MRDVTLFIAMSLDGYIAGKNSNVYWLGGQVPEDDDTVTYQEFIKGIDTVIMGATTYRQLVSELSPDDWVYHGLTTYVVTHRPEKSTDEIIFTNESPENLIPRLKAGNGSGIWICGGASIAQQLTRADLIDRYHISVIPTLLGSGIRLFDTMERERRLRLVCTKSYNGITDLVYMRM